MSLAKLTRPIVLFMLCSFPSVAFAQMDSKAEAGKYFDRGLALAQQGAYVDAVVEFNRAYELSPHFVVLYRYAGPTLEYAQDPPRREPDFGFRCVLSRDDSVCRAP